MKISQNFMAFSEYMNFNNQFEWKREKTAKYASVRFLFTQLVMYVVAW